MIVDKEIIELIKVKPGGNLYHREGQYLEFKESFSLSGLGDYYRDFAAFANNKGGYLIFGITDSPRRRVGLKKKAKEQFDKIDPQIITGHLNDTFSGHIEWEQTTVTIATKEFGAFKIKEAVVKPIIAKKDEGKDNVIKNGEIYYRYGGRTQKIQYSELEAIINKRIKQNDRHWVDLMSKIGKAGPENAAILDTERSVLEKGEARVMVIGDELASSLKFIKEGEFEEKKGAKALKLVGEVQPAHIVEVIKHEKQNLIKEYPLSATDLAKEVKKKRPKVGQNRIWEIITEQNLKNNLDYCAYNFRNKNQSDKYIESGNISKGTPCIYKPGAVDFIVNIIDQAN